MGKRLEIETATSVELTRLERLVMDAEPVTTNGVTLVFIALTPRGRALVLDAITLAANKVWNEGR